jgi:hypothetical protein
MSLIDNKSVSKLGTSIGSKRKIIIPCEQTLIVQSRYCVHQRPTSGDFFGGNIQKLERGIPLKKAYIELATVYFKIKQKLPANIFEDVRWSCIADI